MKRILLILSLFVPVFLFGQASPNKYIIPYDTTQLGINGTSMLKNFKHAALFSNPIVFNGDTIFYWGDSIVAGSVGLVDSTQRWTNILSRFLGCVEVNKAIGGTTLENGTPSSPFGIPSNFISRLATVRTYNGLVSHAALVIGYGTNDFGYNGGTYNLANFKTALDSAFHYLITTKLWIPSKIVIVGTSYLTTAGFNYYASQSGNPAPTAASLQAFIAAEKAAAIKWGAQFIDMYNPMSYSGGDALLQSADHLHPSYLGNSIMAAIAVKYFTGVEPGVISTGGLYDFTPGSLGVGRQNAPLERLQVDGGGLFVTGTATAVGSGSLLDYSSNITRWVGHGTNTSTVANAQIILQHSDGTGSITPIHIQGSTGKVGFGTTSPSEVVHAVGAIMSTGAATTNVPLSATMSFSGTASQFISRAGTSVNGDYTFTSQTGAGGSTKTLFSMNGTTGLPAFPAFTTTGVITNAVTTGVLSSSIGANGQVLATSGTTPTWQYQLGQIVGTPTIIAGAGAGTSPTISVASNGAGLLVTVTTGTLPTGTNATIATVTLPTALSYTPYPVFAPANANASLLSAASMVYMNSTGTANVTITSGTTALTASTTYIWNIKL